jgi:hypothetical protein
LSLCSSSSLLAQQIHQVFRGLTRAAVDARFDRRRRLALVRLRLGP